MSNEVTVERLERALTYCAYLITIHGTDLVPLFERLEQELAALRQEQSAVDRAKALLESYREQHGGVTDATPPPLLITKKPAA